MKIYYQLLIVALLFNVIPSTGQIDFTDFPQPAPLDKNITYGKLENGLSYYIKAIPENENEINLRFYVKAGSNNQDPDQLNFAHLLEHLAFKSTKNFPRGIYNDLELLTELDMSLYSLNGHSGQSSTEYYLKIPTGNNQALETGLRWFKDIAIGLDLKDDQIDTERGVMIQEEVMRTGDNIQKHITERKLYYALFPCKMDASNFIEHHNTFDPGRLKQFYKDWYRPDLMTIIVVGNIKNIPQMKKLIEDNFSDIRTIDSPRKSPACEKEYFTQPPKFAIVETNPDVDVDKNTAQFQLYFRDYETQKRSSSLEGLKRMEKMNLFIDIIGKRFREKADVYNSSFVTQMRHMYQSHRAPSSFRVSVNATRRNEKEALQESLRVLQQIQRHGVLLEEFEAAKEKYINILNNHEPSQSRYWLEEIKKRLIFGEALPGNKSGLLKNWLSDYSFQEFQEFIKSINFSMPDDIGILAPTGHEALTYSEKTVRSWIKSINQETISPYVPPAVPEALISSSEKKRLLEFPYKDYGIGASGSRELLLDNGVKIILKSFKPSPGPYQNKISIHGFNNRGALAFPEEDYFSAIYAPKFIKNSGVGRFNKFELQRFLATTSLPLPLLNLYVNNLESGINLSASSEDIEEMLQLIYLFFTVPRADAEAFQDWKSQEEYFYRNQDGDIIERDLNNSIGKILGDNSVTAEGTERRSGIKKTNMERGFEIYKNTFGRADDFTFIITGNYNTDSIIPLVNKYLGNLPKPIASKKHNNIVSERPKPKGPLQIQFKSQAGFQKNNYLFKPIYIFPLRGDEIDWKEEITAEVIANILRTKLLDLRFDKNFSLYSVSAGSVPNLSQNQIELSAQLSCTPEQYPLLRKEFFNIINDFKKNKISNELLVQGLKRTQIKYHPSGNANTNERAQKNLYNHYKYSMPWVYKNEVYSFIESLTPEDLLIAFNKYFKEEYLYEFVVTN